MKNPFIRGIHTALFAIFIVPLTVKAKRISLDGSMQSSLTHFKQAYTIKPDRHLNIQTLTHRNTIVIKGNEYSLRQDEYQNFNILQEDATYFLNGVPQASLPRVLTQVQQNREDAVFITRNTSDDGRPQNIFIINKATGETIEVVSIKSDIYASIQEDDIDINGLETKYRMWRSSQNAHQISYNTPNLRRPVKKEKCVHQNIVRVAAMYESSFCNHMGGPSNAFQEVMNIMTAVAMKYEQHGLCIKVFISHVEGYCDAFVDPFKVIIPNDSISAANKARNNIEAVWNTNENLSKSDSVQLFTGIGFDCKKTKCLLSEIRNVNENYAYSANNAVFTNSILLRAALVSLSLIHTIAEQDILSFENDLLETKAKLSKGFGVELIKYLSDATSTKRILLKSCKNDVECDDGMNNTTDLCINSTCQHLQNNITSACIEDIDCDDGMNNTMDLCINSTCQHLQNNITSACIEDIECDDGMNNTMDLCINSTCQHLEDVTPACIVDIDCDDGDACTTDSCDNFICLHNNDNSSCCSSDSDCDDGMNNTTDVCINSTCQHLEDVTPACIVDIDCDDGDACTTDSCNNFICLHNIDDLNCCVVDSDCDDGVDNTIDVCVNSACQYLEDITSACIVDANCDDGDACTIDSCDDFKCTHHIIECDDSNACTNDFCIEGICKFYNENPSCCSSDSHCDDENVCTIDSCDNSECTNIEISPSCCNSDVDCDDGDLCTIGFCDDFECKFVNNPNCCYEDSDCDNGIWCDGEERCENNTCTSYKPTCDDNNACTEDSWFCDENSYGCVNSPIGTCCEKDSDCDDGIFCNGEEICLDNQCVAASPPECENGDSCSVGHCSDISDKCVFTMIEDCCEVDADCEDDGSFCNGEEICIESQCVQGPQPICDDGDVCTEGYCSKLNDRCEYLSIMDCCTKDSDCGNGNWCDGIEICEQNKCQPGIVPSCDDNDPCTIGSWVCTNDEIICEITEIESCCRNDEDCQDESFCNGEESCIKNKCTSGTARTCSDGLNGTCDKDTDNCFYPSSDDELVSSSSDDELVPQFSDLLVKFFLLLADLTDFLLETIIEKLQNNTLSI